MRPFPDFASAQSGLRLLTAENTGLGVLVLQIRIQSGEIKQLTPQIRGEILLWPVVPQAEGVAVDLNAAQRVHVWRTCNDLSLRWIALILGGALFFVPRDELVSCIFIVLATLGTLVVMAWFFSVRWRKHAETVVGDMPPPGTPVRIDDSGLTVGSTTTPWPALKLMRVNLRRVLRTYASFRRYNVEQLLLDVAGKRVVLDAAAITHGEEIADTIFNRLIPDDES